MTTLKNFDFLDAYRGIAILAVVCQHAEEFTTKEKTYNGGGFGVPAFFQLSAFLLTYRMLVQYEKNKARGEIKNLKLTLKYFVIRFCRIYLTYLAFCAIHLVYDAVLLGPKYDNLVIHIFYMVFLRIDQLDYRLGHLWTLPVEVGLF